MKGYIGPRRESTTLGTKDESTIISSLDGQIITAMPIPTRQTKVTIDAAKLAEAFEWAEKLSRKEA